MKQYMLILMILLGACFAGAQPPDLSLDYQVTTTIFDTPVAATTFDQQIDDEALPIKLYEVPPQCWDFVEYNKPVTRCLDWDNQLAITWTYDPVKRWTQQQRQVDRTDLAILAELYNYSTAGKPDLKQRPAAQDDWPLRYEESDLK